MDEDTRFGIDAATALRLIREDPTLGDRRRLVAPSVLRSDVLAALNRAVRGGLRGEEEARRDLEGLARLRIRLLNDRVSRARAWQIARRLDLEDTTPAEYVAVADLQADVLVAGDAGLAALARGILPLATYADLVD